MRTFFQFHTARDVCPAVADQPEDCRTCCCKSSDNVDFFHPGGNTRTECRAYESAEYKASLIPTINPICHPDFSFEGGVDDSRFSGLLLLSHRADRFIDKCSTDIELNGIYQFIVNTETVLRGRKWHSLESDRIHDYFLDEEDFEDDDDDDDDECPEVERKRKVGYIDVSPRAA